MILSSLGEFGIIGRIRALGCAAAPQGATGIGDDCAVIPVSAEKSFLVTTDMLVAGRHFLAGHIPPQALGHKSLAVNLSDIAAMGGKPLCAFLSVGLPAATTVDWLDAFMAGFNALAQQYGVTLLGGDTSQSDQIIINITVIGDAHPDQIKYRHTAQAGDVICVTGHLGDSGAGLDIILKHNSLGSSSPLTHYLIHHHYNPHPHLAQGQFLAGHESVHAMMDISDGLASDLKHILKASGVGAQIDVGALPLSLELKNFTQLHDLSAENLALTAGEDYCLLLTVAANAYETLNQQFTAAFSQPIYKIGEITAGTQITFLKGGQLYKLEKTGFDHFK